MIFTRTYDDSLSLICETLRTYILVMPRPENASFRKNPEHISGAS